MGCKGGLKSLSKSAMAVKKKQECATVSVLAADRVALGEQRLWTRQISPDLRMIKVF